MSSHTYSNESRLALRFARLHDWGRDAYLYVDAGLLEYIGGVRNVWVDGAGQVFEETVSLRANLDRIREFGGY